MGRTKDGSADSQQITLSGEVEGGGESKFNRAQAVFVGVDVSWRARISDLGMNTSIAEIWEDVFPSWDLEGRDVHLRSRPLRYRANLGDGTARFMLDGLPGWDLAVDHVDAFLEHLREHDRRTTQVRATVQHLVPVEDQFDDLVEKLVDRLLHHEFYYSLGEPADFAYLVDVIRDGVPHQLAIGALRAHEVSRKVAAQIVDHVPERSIFAEVTGRYVSTEDSPLAVATSLKNLCDFGKSLAEGLAS